MVNFYVKRIRAGIYTNINEIPSRWRNDVRTAIEAEGYTIDEDGTIIKPVL